MDNIGLQDPEEFRGLITSYAHVKALFCGHVHHEFEGRLGDAAVFTSPSTAIQFEPAGDISSYRNDPPGYRIIELDGETVSTTIRRLPTLQYPPGKAAVEP